MAAPVTGTVQQVYYRPGEMVTAGKPVVALRQPISPALLRQRGHVAQDQARRGHQRALQLRADRRQGELHLAPSEYTPPVIYSLEERNKLVSGGAPTSPSSCASVSR